MLGFTQGFLIPLSVLFVSDALHGRQSFRRIPYLVQLLLQVLLLAAMTMVISFACGLVATRDMRIAVANLRSSLVVAFVIAFVIASYSTLREFLGKGFVRDLARGLYEGAREERAIVLFVDIKGSTSIAESLPPIRFFELLDEFFSLVDAYVTYYRGTIYKYVGDGAILVWKSGAENARRVYALVTELQQDLRSRAGRYRALYGRELECTAGVHEGPVLVGGIGRDKRELGYWGDTLNTASRIQGMCKEYGEPVLLSSECVAGMRAPGEATPPLRPIQRVELRGKQGTHTLYAGVSAKLDL